MNDSTSPYIGRPLERLEDDRLLRGQAVFVDDIVLDDMVYLAVLRSPMAHGRITKIDLARSRASKGVVGVYKGSDFASLPFLPLRLAPIEGVERFLQRPIATDKVRFVGEPVAVVVAVSPELAEDALDKIELEIDALPAIVDWASAESNVSLLFEEHKSNVAAQYKVVNGNISGVFSNAPYRRRETFYCQRQTALPMEMRGLIANWSPAEDKMRIWGSTKVLWFNRKFTAEALGLRQDQVDMIGTDIGGSFGVRGELHPEDLLVPFVSKQLGRPVKWIEDRRENLMAANHSREITCELEIACARDGIILGIRGKLYANMGAYKGAGEGGIVGVAAAVANAVAAAVRPLDAEIHSLPLSPQHVWHSIVVGQAVNKVGRRP
jgi:aerobic carbon-monoxide dehydrogenase large subunit